MDNSENNNLNDTQIVNEEERMKDNLLIKEENVGLSSEDDSNFDDNFLVTKVKNIFESNDKEILSEQPDTIVNLEQMHKPEENNLNSRKKIKKENQLFSKNKLLKILKELNLNFENTELISNNLEIFVKNLIRNSITKAISKGRKTLFIEDIKESIKEMRLFYLYDLINE